MSSVPNPICERVGHTPDRMCRRCGHLGWTPAKAERPRRATDRGDIATWAATGLVLGALVGSLFLLQSCERSRDEQFDQACRAHFPGAHMDTTTQYGYKSYYVTRYCIGPNGELWDVK